MHHPRNAGGVEVKTFFSKRGGLALGAQRLDFEVVDQPRAAQPRGGQHDQSVASLG